MDLTIWKSSKGDIAVTDMPNGHIRNCLDTIEAYGMKDPRTHKKCPVVARLWTSALQAEFDRRNRVKQEQEEWEELCRVEEAREELAAADTEAAYWDNFGEAGWHIAELANQIKKLKAEVKQLRRRG